MRPAQEAATQQDGYFGPATDLVFSLAAILVIILAVEMNRVISLQEEIAVQEQQLADLGGTIDLKEIQENQKQLIDAIAESYKVEAADLGDDTYGIEIESSGTNDIVIANEATIQRFRFGSHILFDEDDIVLKPQGRRVMKVVGVAIADRLGQIKEIQVQGHADPETSNRFETNLELAAYRAFSVYNFLKDSLSVDPRRHVMSATTFGEYMPVQRAATQGAYKEEHNSTEEKRARNRRIEILLIYDRK